MTVTLQFFTDAALTTPIIAPLNVQQADDGSTGPVDLGLFLGSTVLGKKFQDAIAPGVTQVTISIIDANPASGQEPNAIKLALTALGLDSAVAGVALDVGLEVLSEVGNATAFFARVEDVTGVIATSLDLSLETQNVIEIDV